MNRRKVNLSLQPTNIIRGVFRLASGDSGGIKDFPNSDSGFSASLAPLIAFPLVVSGLIAATGYYRLAALLFLSRLCTVLIPPLVVEAAARMTDRLAAWLLTATALNWSFWLVLPLMLIAQVVARLLVSAGAPGDAAIEGAVLLLGLYGLWFQWFTIRAGLKLKWWQAVLAVLAMDAGIGLISLLTFQFDRQLLDVVRMQQG